MKITQAYVSESVSDFPFLEALSLTGYVDSSRPCLFIGCYSQEDFDIILNHKSDKIILWCGQDALTAIFMGWVNFLSDCKHITWMVNVQKALKSFVNIKLVNPVFLGGKFSVTPLGKKVFAYCPQSHPSYHNEKLIKEVEKELGVEVVIGDGTTSQEAWLNGEGDKIYDECFIGMCLSGFAGGGQTTIQLGLKGRKVITNVMELPNVINWRDSADVIEKIQKEMPTVHSVNNLLAKDVMDVINNPGL